MSRKPAGAGHIHPAQPRPDASGARAPFVDVEHGVIAVLTPEAAADRGATVRPASHQDLEIAGRRDLVPLLGGGDTTPFTPSNG